MLQIRYMGINFQKVHTVLCYMILKMGLLSSISKTVSINSFRIGGAELYQKKLSNIRQRGRQKSSTRSRFHIKAKSSVVFRKYKMCAECDSRRKCKMSTLGPERSILLPKIKVYASNAILHITAYVACDVSHVNHSAHGEDCNRE